MEFIRCSSYDSEISTVIESFFKSLEFSQVAVLFDVDRRLIHHRRIRMPLIMI